MRCYAFLACFTMYEMHQGLGWTSKGGQHLDLELMFYLGPKQGTQPQHADMQAPHIFYNETRVTPCPGRVHSKRSAGKLVFYDVKADGEKIQIMADVALSAGGDLAAFVALHNGVKTGDIVGAAGHPGKSKKGELSLFPTSFQVLSPCLHMLPLRRLDNQVPPATPAAALHANLPLISNTTHGGASAMLLCPVSGVRYPLPLLTKCPTAGPTQPAA